MKVNLAHLRERARSGGWINFAVFDARSSSGSRDDNARVGFLGGPTLLMLD